eukprot:Trichotokara_eunicae@DN3255_c0_g1_i1.p1
MVATEGDCSSCQTDRENLRRFNRRRDRNLQRNVLRSTSRCCNTAGQTLRKESMRRMLNFVAKPPPSERFVHQLIMNDNCTIFNEQVVKHCWSPQEMEALSNSTIEELRKMLRENNFEGVEHCVSLLVEDRDARRLMKKYWKMFCRHIRFQLLKYGILYCSLVEQQLRI